MRLFLNSYLSCQEGEVQDLRFDFWSSDVSDFLFRDWALSYYFTFIRIIKAAVELRFGLGCLEKN